MPKLQEPISLKDLTETGVTFTVEANSVNAATAEDVQAEKEYMRDVMNYLNNEVAGLEDEDVYTDGSPFDNIRAKMVDLFPGQIKKRIIRQGYGDTPPDKAQVKVHYNAYLEFNSEPFDSTYARKKPHKFIVNDGQVLVGLDLAVQSMKLNEKAQFLLSPIVAYGRMGCLNRVPPNAEVLFEIELLEILNTGAALSFDTLPEDEKNLFSNVYNYCEALCAKGKDLFGKNTWEATKSYNAAVSKLEYAHLENSEEQEKQQKLLLKLYSNLLVCHTILNEPRKGCINFNNITKMVAGTDIQIPAKCYYNNAKCLRMLGDYALAKTRLESAYKLDPKNSDILNERVLLDQEMTKYKSQQMELGKAMEKLMK